MGEQTPGTAPGQDVERPGPGRENDAGPDREQGAGPDRGRTAEQAWLAGRFEEHRTYLRAVARRMLGSASEADDAVQEAWLRLSRSDASQVENMRAWLTTVVSRLCLNALRARAVRREEPDGVRTTDPVATPGDGADPEHEALLADSVGLALVVVLDTLGPDERLAFVLHDVFAVPFEDIARMLERSPAATRQLASRARRRVRGVATAPDGDLRRQRTVVDAFFAAARSGDLDRLVDVLHPDVVLRADHGGAPVVVHGAAAVARRAASFADPAAVVRPAVVHGAAGVVVTVAGRPVSIMGFTVHDGAILAIDALSDPVRLAELDLSVLDG